MINWIRRKLGGPFTRWYVKRGYTFTYDFEECSIHSDGIFNTPLGIPKAVWTCPWWVKPFLIFFSPSVYCMEKFTKIVISGFEDGLMFGKEEKKDEH